MASIRSLLRPEAHASGASAGRKPFLEAIGPSMFQIIARSAKKSPAPRISVVVPTHNRRRLLEDTIQALMAQDLPPAAYEIIVVDNASSDDTMRLLRRTAARSAAGFLAVRLHTDSGPAVARNVGVTLARGETVAFTDSDCVPTPYWLRKLSMAFQNGTGVVQGSTSAPPDQAQPLFNHFIETTRFDGSFSTSNVAYRREAVVAAGGFDAGCNYWEDVDLGWRVRRLGWDARFEPEARVHHQVIPLTSTGWLRHATRVYNYPAKASRYPEFRRHLFLGLWVDPANILFQAAVLGAALGAKRRPFLLLTVPYLASFVTRHRLIGRAPALRAAAHLARDTVSFCAAVAGTIRYRSPVL